MEAVSRPASQNKLSLGSALRSLVLIHLMPFLIKMQLPGCVVVMEFLKIRVKKKEDRASNCVTLISRVGSDPGGEPPLWNYSLGVLKSQHLRHLCQQGGTQEANHLCGTTR